MVAHRPRSAAMTLLAAALLLGGCSAGTSLFAGPPPQHISGPVSYLDLEDPPTVPAGGSASFPQALLSAALPKWTTFYEAEVEGPVSSLGQAEALAEDLRPTFVTVSFGMTDALEQIPSSQLAGALAVLLRLLKADGATTVLVANLIPANLAPLPLGCPVPSCRAQLAGEIGAYNAAIAAEASGNGAVLVNLHGALEGAIREHGAEAVFSPDAYGLSSLGAETVEKAFLHAVWGRQLDREGVRAR